MTSKPGLQTVTIHTLPNISQSKGNQKMQFRQLIEYNRRNIFPRKIFYPPHFEYDFSRKLFLMLHSIN